MTRNRQTGPDEAAGILAGLIPRITYKPGWQLELKELDREQGSQGLTLCISATVPDSLHPGQTVTFLHLMPVLPAAYDEETWVRWVLDQLLLVEQHEALEFYRVDDAQPYFPEHAPGRNPYTIAQVKTPQQAHAAAQPFYGRPATGEHFR